MSEILYDGLSELSKISLDHSAGGLLHMKKMPEEAQELIEMVQQQTVPTLSATQSLSDLTTIVSNLSKTTHSFMVETRSSIRNLEIQVSKLSRRIPETPSNTLPSKTEVNSKEECKTLTMEAEAESKEENDAEDLKENKAQEEIGSVTMHVPIETKEPEEQPSPNMREEPEDEQLAQFLAVLRKLQVNISFAEVLKKKPPYMACLNNVISEKTVLKGDKTVALCDLGSSINLMPLSVMRKLEIQEVQPTKISLGMADKSLKRAYGLVENVFVKVEDLYLPADFMILDIGEDKDNSIIFRRPFLATAKALIDVLKGELVLRLWEDYILFKILNPQSLSDKGGTTAQHLVFQPSLSVQSITEPPVIKPKFSVRHPSP
ncbi:uncharacterized protein LOC107610858 [Arachis ipaensis]|uniref:uncharacterized protein LOC107610858 n=1 Tax=Arachis ipaensis TaxID=130454 RepID=UPI0007AF7AFC|nr:uncharacterized protein LOC107610858 [Arachis ipaensis]